MAKKILLTKAEMTYILNAAMLPQGIFRLDDLQDGILTKKQFTEENEITPEQVDECAASLRTKMIQALKNRS